MVQLQPALMAQHQHHHHHLQLQLQQMPSSQQQGLNFCGGTRSVSSASLNSCPGGNTLDLLESAQCQKHAPQAASEKMGWAEKESGSSLPLVNVSLQVFGRIMRRVVKVRF